MTYYIVYATISEFRRMNGSTGPSILNFTERSRHFQKAHGYRDRAAERRNVHEGFGFGAGQKKTAYDDDTPSAISVPTKIAVAEALTLSFGEGILSRKLMEKMGWNEGETLGKSNNGLKEPLQAVQNKGKAGIGWSQKYGMGQ